jgi:hypothetical protein
MLIVKLTPMEICVLLIVISCSSGLDVCSLLKKKFSHYPNSHEKNLFFGPEQNEKLL